MRKSTKIITIVLACTVAACCVIVGIGSVTDKGETTTQFASQTTAQQAETTVQIIDNTTASANVTDLSKLILGKWTDSVNMSGFEFFENNTVAYTYVNLESFNIPFSGTANNGIYTLEGNKLTVKYTIYSGTIEKKYEIGINNDILTMRDVEDSETLTYKRAVQDTTDSTTAPIETTVSQTTSKPTSVGDELFGSWSNQDASIKYEFKADGTVLVSLSDVILPDVGTVLISGSFDGVYLTDGDEVIIQYSAFSKKITEKYNFAVSKNTATFTDNSGKTVTFTREGTGYKPSNEDDLLGIWRDSANMSGYEFKENGIAKITVVNLKIPIIDRDLNGTFSGSYEINGNEITISFSIYGKTVSESYIYEINGNILSLTNKSDNNVSTYLKK